MFKPPGLGGRRLGHRVALPSCDGADSTFWVLRLQSLITCTKQQKDTAAAAARDHES